MSTKRSPARRDRPNIVWIYCDELRADALRCYGNALVDIETPHIDGLAERGVLFEQCFVNSPICVSSRASLHTGLLPEQSGVYGNEAYAAGYPLPHYTTFPEVLAAAGYATASFGKEHIPHALTPWRHNDPAGSTMFEIVQSVDDPSTLQLVRNAGGGVVGGRFPADRPYPPAKVVDNLLAWMAEADGPFLARAALLQPHTPVIPPEPYASKYEGAPWPDRAVVHPGLSRFERVFGEVNGALDMSPEDFVTAQAHYHGQVAWIDDEVGRLLRGLRAQGLDGNTVVILTSDHGHYLGEEGAFGKHTFAPQSQRVPLIVSWPGVLPQEQRRDDLAQALDFARTVFALAGVEAPDQFGGRDLFADPAPEHVFATIGYGERQSYAFPNLMLGRWTDDRGWPRRSCVRTERYRLDRTTRIDGEAAPEHEWDVFLADYREDSAEVVNRADDPALAEVRAALLAAVHKHVEQSVETPAEVVYSTANPGLAAI